MIGFFRSIFQSKIGLFLTLAFVGLIAVAFAGGDVTGGAFGGIGSSQTAVTIGSQKISTSELRRQVENAYSQARQQNPTLDMAAFIAGGGVDEVIRQMVNSYAIAEYGKSIGLGAGKRLVDSEITALGVFRNAAGNFDEATYRRVLADNNINEEQFREQLKRELLAEQMLDPINVGTVAPDKLIMPYASLLLEGRRGRIATLPSAAFVDDKPVSDDALKAFYTQNAARFTLPEQRSIRYTVFTRNQVIDDITISETEIKEAFEQRREEFSARETRLLEQVILPTEDGAKALLDTVNGGTSLAVAADAIGLASSEIGQITKGELASEASNAVADAAFGTNRGEMAPISQSPLGWHVMRVLDIEQVAERSLDDVRASLENDIREEKSRQALSDFTVSIEDRLQSGATLSDIAQSEKLEVNTTPLLTANGQSIAQPGYQIEPIVRGLLTDAFKVTGRNVAQIVETTQGLEFVIFDVSDIKAAAPPPFADNKEAILRVYRIVQGSERAEKLAREIAANAKDADSLISAVAARDEQLPPVENVGAKRAQLTAGGQRVPPPLALMFSMPEGSFKVLEGPNDQAWFIVYLEAIDRGDASGRSDIVNRVAQDFRGVLAREYAQQLIQAVKDSIEVKRNETVIKSVIDDLTGANQTG
ncbi:MAG: SurA N-terminal domain-containing protein [Pseudomonadota bacterium]